MNNSGANFYDVTCNENARGAGGRLVHGRSRTTLRHTDELAETWASGHVWETAVQRFKGQFFPELRMYHENQVETVKCPRSCSLDGGSVAFCIFDNATSAVARLDFYLSYELLGNDCGGRTSGNGSAFISFRVKQRMSGSTIYCAQSMLHCSSLVNTLIPPLLIIVEAEHRCSNGESSPMPSPTPISPAIHITSTPPATPSASSSPTHITTTPLPTPSSSPTHITTTALPTQLSSPTHITTTPLLTQLSSPTHTTSTPPPTRTKSAENLSSQLPTSSSLSSMPNSTPPITEPVKSLVGGVAAGVFIAGLLLGVTCGIGITLNVTRCRKQQVDQHAWISRNRSGQEP